MARAQISRLDRGIARVGGGFASWRCSFILPIAELLAALVGSAYADPHMARGVLSFVACCVRPIRLSYELPLIYIVAENLARESRVFRFKHVRAREIVILIAVQCRSLWAQSQCCHSTISPESVATLAWQESAVIGEALVAGVPTRHRN